MSPDEIFAAQFWPWPDPAIKRDAQGRVLFVNAAFLSLYGGRVEDWQGNAVGGWPAPQTGSTQPFRFETRLPNADGSERIFDWMEQMLADGNAFALARDVTAFMTPPEPTPGEVATPEVPLEQAPEVHAPTYEQQAPAETYAPVMTEAAPVIAAAPEMSVQTAEIAIPDIPVPDIPIPDIAIPDTVEAAAVAPAVEETVAVQAPIMSPEQPAREYERRALPIEDESAVLGNNWRDAVIAKAVGAADVAESPTAAQAPAEAPAAPAPSTDGGPITILLAEDNAINALLTRTLLEAEGHTVDTVEDGQLAVEAVKTKSYDLIFMDMRMPNMDGLEATRKIRDLPLVPKNLPVIALTANAFDDDRNACFDSGMNDFMTKPVSAEELSEMVTTWTGPKAEARQQEQAA
jgi:CheY-like chemotaxis protein